MVSAEAAAAETKNNAPNMSSEKKATIRVFPRTQTNFINGVSDFPIEIFRTFIHDFDVLRADPQSNRENACFGAEM